MISLNFSFIHYMSYNVSHGLKIMFFCVVTDCPHSKSPEIAFFVLGDGAKRGGGGREAAMPCRC